MSPRISLGMWIILALLAGFVLAAAGADLLATHDPLRHSRLLRLRAALPFFLAGLRISGGLSLVGAVVAEFVAGSGGVASGLAYRILESGYRLQIPKMFAALVLLLAAGLAINAALGLLSTRLLRRYGREA